MDKLGKTTYYGSGADAGWLFWCPGCKCGHRVITDIKQYGPDGAGPVWGWNGSTVCPTFTPSLLVWSPTPGGGRENVCHSYITDGKIQYLSDCQHELAGKTVELESWNGVLHN